MKPCALGTLLGILPMTEHRTSTRKNVEPTTDHETATKSETTKLPRVELSLGGWVKPPKAVLSLANANQLFTFELVLSRACSSAHCVSLSWGRSDSGELVYIKDKILSSEINAAVFVSDAADKLSEFYADVADVQEQGAVFAHDLAKKTVLLEASFSQHGLTTLSERWKAIGSRGFCLTDPEIGRWLDMPMEKPCLEDLSSL